MDVLQPNFFSTGNPQINVGFQLIVSGTHVATYMFKCFDVDAFQPQHRSANSSPASQVTAHSSPPRWRRSRSAQPFK